jgi:hypothetical protein
MFCILHFTSNVLHFAIKKYPWGEEIDKDKGYNFSIICKLGTPMAFSGQSKLCGYKYFEISDLSFGRSFIIIPQICSSEITSYYP